MTWATCLMENGLPPPDLRRPRRGQGKPFPYTFQTMKPIRHSTALLSLLLVPLWALAEHNPLLPQPQEIHYGSGSLLVRGLEIRLPSDAAPEDRFAADELSSSLARIVGSPVFISADGSTGKAITLRRSGAIDPLASPGEKAGPDSREAYSIDVTSDGVKVEGRSSAAVYYGVETLAQLVEGSGAGARLPEVQLHDWPSLPFRGVMVDTSHGGLPTEAEVKRQIDFLARWKNNQYYLYSEASIALEGFSILGRDAQFSPDEIRSIVAYGRERHIDVVPCMELYGHLHDLFRVERYAGLAILPHGSEFDPRNPQVAALMRHWVEQLTDLFPSRFFHIGFDETREAPVVAASDKALPAALYQEQFQLVSGLIRQHGRTLLVWSDMFAQYPNLIPLIPEGTIIVPWGYDRTVYEPYWKPFENSPLPRFVATGVSIWDQVAPNFDRSFDNIDTFLGAGRPHGISGLINTLWADDIAVLYRPAYPGLAYGAAAAWQAVPVNRGGFFSEYARIMYGEAAATEVASGLAAVDRSENELALAVDGGRPQWEETSPSFWDDPLTAAHLARATSQNQHFHQSRIEAEEAIEHLGRAMRLGADPSTLDDTLLEARLLDYVGMKNVYAAEMASYWHEMGEHPEASRVEFWVGQFTSHDHSLIEDLMESSGDLPQAYRAAWLDTYTPYRLGVIMGKWSAEFQYWWKLSRRLQDAAAKFHPGDSLPSLESLSPGF